MKFSSFLTIHLFTLTSIYDFLLNSWSMGSPDIFMNLMSQIERSSWEYYKLHKKPIFSSKMVSSEKETKDDIKNGQLF